MDNNSSTIYDDHSVQRYYEKSAQDNKSIALSLLTSYVLPSISQTDSFIDIGCGTGEMLHNLWKNGYNNIQGCEVSKEMIKQIYSKLPNFINIIDEDFCNFEFGRSFDVSILQAFIHLFKQKKAVTVMKKIIKLTNKRIYFTTTKHSWYDEGEREKLPGVMYFRTQYNKRAIEELIKLSDVENKFTWTISEENDSRHRVWFVVVGSNTSIIDFESTGSCMIPTTISGEIVEELKLFTNNAFNLPNNGTYLRFGCVDDIVRIEKFIDHVPMMKEFVYNVLVPYLNLTLGGSWTYVKGKINRKRKNKTFPIHQDASAGWNGQNISVMIPLSDTSIENGCLYYTPHNLTNVVSDIVDKSFINMLDFKPLIMKTGEMFLFNQYVIHYSSLNKTNKPRDLVILTFKYYGNDKELLSGYTRKCIRQPPVDQQVKGKTYISDRFGKYIELKQRVFSSCLKNTHIYLKFDKSREHSGSFTKLDILNKNIKLRVTFDTIIVGFGVSGASLCSTLTKSKLSFLCIEKGNDCRTRNPKNPFDLVTGSGGSGNYSDGTYSFFPAGIKMYNVEDRNRLRLSYSMLEEALGKYIPNVPSFPENIDNVSFDSLSSHQKKYFATYIGLKDRLKIIEDMEDSVSNSELGNVLFNTEFLSYEKINETYVIQFRNVSTKRISQVYSKNLVFATGRFGTLDDINKKTPKVYKRIDIGFKVQFSNEYNSLFTEDGLDPKFIAKRTIDTSCGEVPVEIRTFCFCRDGMADQSKYKRTDDTILTTFSGRSDCPATKYTNFGFNVSFKTYNEEIYQTFKHFLTSHSKFNMKLSDFDNLKQHLPKIFVDILKQSLRIFTETFPKFKQIFDDKETTIIGPTIEGVGFYQTINPKTLKLPGHNIHVIGDCSGIFRGIISSMLSGYYVALDLMNKKNPSLIVLSGKSKTGKTTVEHMIQDYFKTNELDMSCIRYADRLKFVVSKMFNLDISMLNTQEGKEGHIDEWSMTRRELLQYLGTSLEHTIPKWDNMTYLDKFFFSEMDKLIKKNHTVLLSDLRILSTYEHIKNLPIESVVIKLNRNNDLIYPSGNIPSTSKHFSETSLDSLPNSLWDFIINNNGTLDELKSTVYKILDKLYK